jgi:crotonobetainyl-CoA:carnitine CoA-transferase CaiB-like acyl-CoA transferase
MSITGLPGQGPVRAGIPIADLCAGLFCAMGILTALLEREVSGEGQWVQTSLLAAQIFMLDFQAARWTMGHEVAPQAGNNHPTSIPTGVFPTRDGHINIASAGQAIWERLARAVGAEGLLADPRFADAASRSQHRDALNEALAEHTAGFTSGALIEILNEAGVPCGPIYTIDQVFADPQVRHLGIAQRVNHPTLGEIELVGQPFTLSRTPTRLVRPTPERGQDTDTVLAGLGLNPEEIRGLRERNIV